MNVLNPNEKNKKSTPRYAATTFANELRKAGPRKLTPNKSPQIGSKSVNRSLEFE